MTASRSRASSRRVLSRVLAVPVIVVGLAGWASPSGGETEAGASAQANAAAEFQWTYRYAGGKAGRAAVEAAVEAAVADMNVLVRGIARRKLLDANKIVEQFGFDLGGDPLRASFIDGNLVESPASGAAVDWVNQFGETVKVSQRWSGQKLVQRMFSDDGSRTNVYRFSEDGQRMTMSVTIKASRLPTPIRYRLSYRKKGS